MIFKQITIKDLLNGCLLKDKFTVLLIPGGFAPHTLGALGSLGVNFIRDFVYAGGGFVGICAGAYIGCKFGLGLLDVEVINKMIFILISLIKIVIWFI